MSDVIISRRGRSKGSSGNGTRLVTEYITANTNWIVPEGVKDNKFDVRIFGAGATVVEYESLNWNAGGSGWMNNDILELTPGDSIPITIGWSYNKSARFNLFNNNFTTRFNTSNYYWYYTGESTSFGTYLSASGGQGINGGAAGHSVYNKPIAYQFGGGGGNEQGGDGGVWGGGGSGNKGGNGGIYGGGGGSSFSGGSNLNFGGGNGGKYGGGGGGAIIIAAGSGFGYYGKGGEYGGNGGNKIPEYFTHINSNTYAKYLGNNSENGTNTMGIDSIPLDFRGEGLGGGNYSGGGGGYGGNGGNGYVYIVNNSWLYTTGGGGGGGYGGNGGDSFKGKPSTHGGAGGGGYGGDGESYTTGRFGGGGGGYGKQSVGKYGGGGGYYCIGGGINLTGGGGGIGIWDNGELVASYASGGTYPGNTKSGYYQRCGEPGICIIQYYI